MNKRDKKANGKKKENSNGVRKGSKRGKKNIKDDAGSMLMKRENPDKNEKLENKLKKKPNKVAKT